MNYGDVYAIDIGVVGEVSAVPAAALIPRSTVAEAVIDAAIEADLRTPISFMEKKRVAAPAPITWSPEEADLGWFDPRSRHPVISVAVVVSPVAGGPEVAVSGTDWLFVDGNRRWTEADRNPDTNL